MVTKYADTPAAKYAAAKLAELGETPQPSATTSTAGKKPAVDEVLVEIHGSRPPEGRSLWSVSTGRPRRADRC